MISIRRWYTLIASAVSLQVVVWALINFLRGILPPGSRLNVEELSFVIAVIIIGLPVFLVHWLWAQRSAGRDVEEQASTVRRLYLYAMMGSFLAPLVANVDGLVGSTLRAVLGLARPDRFDIRGEGEMIVDGLIAIAVLIGLWFYHWKIVNKDKSAAGEDDSAGAIRRLYLFVFCSAGLLMTFIAFTRLLRWIMFRVDQTRYTILSSEQLLGEEIARLLTGVGIWLIFWLGAQRLFSGDAPGERASAVRKLYLYVAVFSSVMVLVSNLVMILAGFLRRLLGLSSLGDIRDPLPLVIGGALAWAYHARVLNQDAAGTRELGRQALVRRIYFYLVAAVGLAALLVGVAGSISVLVRALDNSGVLNNNLREQLAIFSAAWIAGTPVWLLAWWPVQRLAVSNESAGNAERRSIVRQVYLYFFILVATLTVLASAIYFVSQFVSLLLGGRDTAGLLSDAGQAIAFTIIGIGVWLYHGYLLRNDGRLKRAAGAKQMAEWRVAILDGGDGHLGRALLDGLTREMPGLQLEAMGLSPEAAAIMNGSAEPADPARSIIESQIIIGPWSMARAAAAQETTMAEITQAITESPGHKLLVPVYEEGWAWTGVDRMNNEAVVKQAVHAVKQIVAGEEVSPARELGIGSIVAIIVGLIALFFLLVGSLASFLF